MWSTLSICLFMVLSVNAYSKYGRTCKDIGCLNSEICVIAEDPCSYGRTSDCGTYPTCKKKSATGSESHNIPVTKATTPKPIADLKPQAPKYDDVPNYPPPAPPRGSSFGNTNTNGGGYPFGNTNGGGNPYGSYPYGNTNGGGSNPYGSIGGGGSNPYGSIGGGGSNPYGNIGGGGRNPYGSNTGGGSNPFGGSSSGGSTNGGSNPFGNFNFGTLFGNGNGGSTGGNKDSGSFGTIFSGILSNLTKNLPNIPNFNPGMTRPGLIDNRNPNPYGNTYSSSGSYYPSYNQPSNTQGQPSQQNGYIAKNYGSSSSNTYSYKNTATTAKPSFFKRVLG